MIEPVQATAPARRHGLSESEMKAICDRILSFAKADNTRVNIASGIRGFTRTAMNRITTAGSTNDISIRVTSVFGKRIASVDTNRIDAASLEKTVRECEALARISPECIPDVSRIFLGDVRGVLCATRA